MTRLPTACVGTWCPAATSPTGPLVQNGIAGVQACLRHWFVETLLLFRERGRRVQTAS
jgi:hypothetical protein